MFAGFAYVAFVTDVYSRRIVGWNVGGRLDGLIHHADHGSNYTAMVYTDRIVELGAVPSTGTVGDSFDNAMAEAINNLYKIELIRQRGPWRTPAEVENAHYADLESAEIRHLPDKAPERDESQADSP